METPEAGGTQTEHIYDNPYNSLWPTAKTKEPFIKLVLKAGEKAL